VLTGKASPSGRLPFSWPTHGSDVGPEEDYTMTGRTYRYAQQDVRWAFGHGLSYSTFTYTNARASPMVFRACTTVNLTFTVTNTGDVPAAEVAQAYVRWTATTPPVAAPALSLVDFAFLPVLQPGQAFDVTLRITPRAMAVLTNPQCGTGETHADTTLAAPPLRTLAVADAGACCAACAAVERCEAYTYTPAMVAMASLETAGGQCALHTAWARAAPAQGAVSGQPLPAWVVRPGSLEVAVGGSSVGLQHPITLSVTGSSDVPVAQC